MRRRAWERAGSGAVVAAVVVFALAPFAWVVISGFLPEVAILTVPPDWIKSSSAPATPRHARARSRRPNDAPLPVQHDAAPAPPPRTAHGRHHQRDDREHDPPPVTQP